MLQLLRLIDSLGQVGGRKKLQKIVHILKACGHDFPQHFGYLHYGPFSSEVAGEIDALVAGDLVEEQGEGLPYEAYVYQLKPSAHLLLADLHQAGAATWQALAQQLNQRNVSDLEAMSTVLYLQANGFTGDALKKRFSELKPALKLRYPTAAAAVKKLPHA